MNKSLPPSRGKVRMGVVRLNNGNTYLDRTTPALTLPLHGEGTRAAQF